MRQYLKAVVLIVVIIELLMGAAILGKSGLGPLYLICTFIVLFSLWKYKERMFPSMWMVVINTFILSLLIAPTVIPFYGYFLIVPGHIAILLGIEDVVYIYHGIISIIICWIIGMVALSDKLASNQHNSTKMLEGTPEYNNELAKVSKYINNPERIDVYAKRMGLSESDVDKMIRKAKLRGYSFGGNIYIEIEK